MRTARLLRPVRRFADEARASLSVEAALMAPLLLTIYAASFVWFNLFDERNLTVKSAYTIADLLSRETKLVDADYIEGMGEVFDSLVTTEKPSTIRVTYVECTADCQTDARHLKSVWSYATGDEGELTDADLARDYISRIPQIVEGDTSLLIETFSPYTPAFHIPGLTPGTFKTVVTTRPRFAPQMKWTR